MTTMKIHFEMMYGTDGNDHKNLKEIEECFEEEAELHHANSNAVNQNDFITESTQNTSTPKRQNN